MGYIKEFSDKITVPDFLQVPPWEDVSWHNDMCPRFENPELCLAVWVDYDTVEEREYDDWKKFTVVELIPEFNNPPSLGEEVLFATEDEAELKQMLSLHETQLHLEKAQDALQQCSKPEEVLLDELVSLIQLVSDRLKDL